MACFQWAICNLIHLCWYPGRMANEINLKIARSSESHSHLCYGTPLPVFPLIDATQALTCSESSMFIFTLLLQPHIHTHTKTKKKLAWEIQIYFKKPWNRRWKFCKFWHCISCAKIATPVIEYYLLIKILPFQFS